MKQATKLSITEPCTLTTWNKMTPNAQGRYCDHCSMTIIDFTKMTDSEIKEYFVCHSGKKICGKIREAQPVKNNRLKKFLADFADRIEMNFHQPSFKIVLLSSLAVLAFVTGCHRSSYKFPVGTVQQRPQIDTTQIQPTPKQ